MYALIISETVQRFNRAAEVATWAGFEHSVQLPAIFTKDTVCKGTTGHQKAVRNAWRLINTTKTPACVFEDDIIVRPGVSRQEIQSFVSENIHHWNVLYLGYHGTGYGATHAMCMDSLGANLLLKYTNVCLRTHGQGIDFPTIHKLCNNKRITCLRAPTRKPRDSWHGYILQNRSMPSYLNGPIRIQRIPKHL